MYNKHVDCTLMRNNVVIIGTNNDLYVLALLCARDGRPSYKLPLIGLFTCREVDPGVQIKLCWFFFCWIKEESGLTIWSCVKDFL